MIKVKEQPSREQLRELFHYDGNNLFWRERPSNRVNISLPAGYIKTNGYRVIGVNKKLYRAHRLIWIYNFGDIPEGKETDHINHNKLDNRVKNLRLVTHQGNGKNQSKHKDNTSGITGVYWNKRKKKWHARISVNGKLIHLGYFRSKHTAEIARQIAEIKNGYHKNHGVLDV